MENMDKRPKWVLVLIVQLKILQMPQNLSAQFVCPSPKVISMKKKLHWASVVRGLINIEAKMLISNLISELPMFGSQEVNIGYSDKVEKI